MGQLNRTTDEINELMDAGEVAIAQKVGRKGTGTGAEVFNDYSNNKASGPYSHAEGSFTTASSYHAHAEGYFTKASSYYAHAEGNRTTASGDYSHAEGKETEAYAITAHAEGYLCMARGQFSHAEGANTEAANQCEHACGEWNVSRADADNGGNGTRWTLGIGTQAQRKNAVEVAKDGSVYVLGVGGYDGITTEGASTLQEAMGNGAGGGAAVRLPMMDLRTVAAGGVIDMDTAGRHGLTEDMFNDMVSGKVQAILDTNSATPVADAYAFRGVTGETAVFEKPALAAIGTAIQVHIGMSTYQYEHFTWKEYEYALQLTEAGSE